MKGENMQVSEMLIICCLILVFVVLGLWNAHQEKRIDELESLALSTSSLLLKVVDHNSSFKRTDSLIVANVNRIYELLNVEWEIRLKPDSTGKDTSYHR